MPYFTTLPDSLLDLDLDTPILSIGENTVLNTLPDSTEFSFFDVGVGGDDTLERGEGVSLLDENENPLQNLTYGGEATTSNANAGVTLTNPLSPIGPSDFGSLTVTLNPVTGSVMSDANGNVYFVSDDPLDEDHLSVTVDFSLLNLDAPSITVPISGLRDALADTIGDIPLIGALTNQITDLAMNAVQSTLDAAIQNMSYNPDGTFDIPEGQFTCFAAGTMIETQNGPVAVEDLEIGDMVLTKDEGYQPIRWIGTARIPAVTLSRKPNLRPIRIKAGALGEDVPSSDLLVSPQHRILVRSRIAQRMFGTVEVLVAAKQLLQLDGIDYDDGVASVEYVHILFDKHQVIVSNGAETESLFTGPQALEAVGEAARAEILELFPMLEEVGAIAEAARTIPSGRQARKLSMRLMQNKQAVVN